MNLSLPLRLLWALIALTFALPAAAQNYAVRSITTGDFGNIVAAASGQTTFQASPASGTVTRLSGSGNRVSASSVRSLVTVFCDGGSDRCSTQNVRIRIAAIGTPTNRAAALRNLTVSTSGASATIVTAPGTGSSITFTAGPIGKQATKTFWVGYDFPIDGDNSGKPTGLSSAQFQVSAERLDSGGIGSLSGTVSASVSRGLALTKAADLSFGAMIRPASGTGTASVDAGSGALTLSGAGIMALAAPAASAARFQVAGEGGQMVSVTIPSSFTMSGTGGTLTVTTQSQDGGARQLSGVSGEAGTLDIRVGGSFPLSSSTAFGTYSGQFAVTVQYN